MGRRPEMTLLDSEGRVDATVALEFTGIVKRFPGVVALKGVTMSVRSGEVHAIVGENGAGKSTLMAILAGAERANEGRIVVAGKALEGGSPQESLERGIAVVYQHASIAPDLTVEENLILGVPRTLRPSRRDASRWANEKLSVTGASVHPKDRVAALSPTERQLIEIAKAAAAEARILVLDEPTESLTAQETERLFDHIRSVTASGTTVIYISHRLGDIKAISDRLTVLRDGQTRGTFETAGISEHQILELIVGGDINHAFPPKATTDQIGDVVLSVEEFCSGRARDVSFTVRSGEIMGLAGIDGNGQQDLVRGLAGLRSSSGRVSRRGVGIDVSTPAKSMASGIAHLPEDRHDGGLFMALSVRENLTALSLSALARGGIVSHQRETEAARRAVRAFGVKTASTEHGVATLSGGNQQKVLFARARSLEADLLIAAEPTRGVDVGARLEIYQEMRRLTADGKAIVVLSSDAMELEGLCDRVEVFSRGRIVRSLKGTDVTEAQITGAALNASGAATVGSTAGTRQDSRRSGWTRFRGGDYFPATLVALLCVAFATVAGSHSPLFLGERNVSGMLLLLCPLVLASFAQLVVVMSGGFDLSVGSVMSMTAVILSYYAQDGQGPGSLLSGLTFCLLAALSVGLANGLMIVGLRFSPVLATLVTFILVQGVALLVRSTPDGLISMDLSTSLTRAVGPVPVVMLACLAVAVVAEVMLRWTVPGIAIRAVGSDPGRARRLGTSVGRATMAAYLVSALLASLAGMLLYLVIGVGDATAGTSYLLMCISAVVLSGASIYGGSGSFLGTFLGALLIIVVVSSASFLRLGTAWQQLLPGLMIVVGAALYSRARPDVADRRGGL